MKTPPLRPEVHASMVLGTMQHALECVVDRTGALARAKSSPGRTASPRTELILMGTLLFLASLKEAMVQLVELDTEFKAIQTRYAHDLEEWHLMRHDSAHFFDRLNRKKCRDSSRKQPTHRAGRRLGGKCASCTAAT